METTQFVRDAMRSQYGFAVYAGKEPEGHAIARTYMALRQRTRHFEGRPPHAKPSDKRCRYVRTYTAAEALAEARAKVAAGDRLPFPQTGLASYGNKPNERGGRWIERPDLAGLRFVGFADKLANLRHTGWFQHPGGDPADVYRAAVYQLPARDGRAVYVEGYISGESTRDGFRESSTMGNDESKMPAVVFLNCRHVGQARGDEYAATSDCEQAVKDAAYGADREAELAGERETAYQESYGLGRQAADLIEEAAEARESAREMLGELRQLGRNAPLTGGSPALCAALREVIAGKLKGARRAYRKAAKLWEEHGEPVSWQPDLADAFADAAGAASYWESRK